MTKKDETQEQKENRIVKFVKDHKVGVTFVVTWVVTSATVLIGSQYDVKKSYWRGWRDGAQRSCGCAVQQTLSCICDHTDLAQDQLNDVMKEFASDYGFVLKDDE